MISLKRNSKGVLAKATGLRTRASSIYKPGQEEIFKVSRSKFNDFLTCQRCFYLDRVSGIVSPGTPGWTLNETTDLLLKKEFDACRTAGLPHRSFEKYGLSNVVPFDHPEIDDWRNSLHKGIAFQIPETNIILHGGVDDIWFDQNTQEIIIVDYKSQANRWDVTTESYLRNVYHQSYKVQMDVYAYILKNMGYDVGSTSYFYVCNANREAEGFFGIMEFKETLVPYNWEDSWIENSLKSMFAVLNDSEPPISNESCENCAYSMQRAAIGF